MLHHAHGSSLVTTKSFRPFIFGLHVLFSLVETSNLVAILMLLVEESEGSSLLGLSHCLVHRICKRQLFIHLSQSDLGVVSSRDKIVILRNIVRRNNWSGVLVITNCRRHHSRLSNSRCHHSRLPNLHTHHVRVLIDHTWLSDHAWLLHLHAHHVWILVNHAWLGNHSRLHSHHWLLHHHGLWLHHGSRSSDSLCGWRLLFLLMLLLLCHPLYRFLLGLLEFLTSVGDKAKAAKTDDNTRYETPATTATS